MWDGTLNKSDCLTLIFSKFVSFIFRRTIYKVGSSQLTDKWKVHSWIYIYIFRYFKYYLDKFRHIGSIAIKIIVVVILVGQTVGSVSSKTLAYECLYILELCTLSMIATVNTDNLEDFLPRVCPNGSWKNSLFCCLQPYLVAHSKLLLFILGKSVEFLMWWNVFLHFQTLLSLS